MKKKYILLFVLILGAFLRLYRLDSYPALNADEAAIGYNVYSLIETGKDEHGNPWPLQFQSFNDYKPGLYFYLVLPFVKYLGLNAWSVRLPGALAGIGTVLVIYYLVIEMLGKDKKTEMIAYLSSFFLAISPWHIHFSRGAWEVNVATLFITLGVWLCIKSVNENYQTKTLILSIIFFVLSMYTYHAARIIAPLLVFGLLISFGSLRRKNRKKMVLGLMFAFLLLVPLGFHFIKGSALSRAAGVGLFADLGPIERIHEQRGEHNDFRSVAAFVLHNKLVNFSLAFLDNWGQHFHGEFLFISGDEIQRNKVPETGQMYLFDILFVGCGLVEALKNIKQRKILLFWLIIAPAASALTFQSPHALRAQNMVVPLVIMSASGLVTLSFWFEGKIKSKKLLDLIFIVFVLLVSWNFSRYLFMYWGHLAKEYPFSSQYGVEELVNFVEQKEGDYNYIVVSDKYDQPYILFLFYLKYPPYKFQKDHYLTVPNKYGFSTVDSFGQYLFKSIDWNEDKSEYQNSLIIGTDEEIPDDADIIEEIEGINGYKYFQVVAN